MTQSSCVVNKAALGRVYEANVVDALRWNHKLILSLMIDMNGHIVGVGHVAFNPIVWTGFRLPATQRKDAAIAPAPQPQTQATLLCVRGRRRSR